MHSILGLPLAATLLSLAGSVVAHGAHDAHAPLASRHHSRDITLQKRQACGPDSGSCSNGECCSQYGWCGSTVGHCGTGCKPQFGSCTSQGGNEETGGGDGGSGGGANGGGILDVPRPKLGSVPYGVHVTTCTVPGTIAITFDDGPYLYTSKLLDTLAKYDDVNVTFFINGHNWANTALGPYPAILRRMIADGHQIGSHTDNHLDLNAIDSAARKQQMAGVEEITRDIFGTIPTYMRPPFGKCNAACQADMSALGYHVIMWNVDTLDYDNNTPDTIQNSVQVFDMEVAPNATGKYITLEHDVHQTTVDVLAEATIKTALARGYKLVTAGDCLGDPAGNWYRDAETGEAVDGDGGSGNPGGENPGGGEPGGGEPVEPELPPTPNGECGSNNGGYTCLGSWAGDCCSPWGWCGRSDGHCGAGCQAKFGKCN